MRAYEFITEAIDYTEYARELAKKHNVPFSIIQHAMNKETGHLSDPSAKAKAVSRAGAQGVMQLMPGTAKHLGVTNPFDPKQNIQGGVKYLAQLYDKFQDPKLALAAYNYGPGNVNKWLAKGGDPSKLPRETRRYVYGDPNKNIPGYVPDEEIPNQAAAAPDKSIGLSKKAAKAVTNVIAAATGSKNAYSKDEVPTLKVGPTITPIKSMSVEPASTPTSDTIINRGDTLSSIARSKGTTVQDIMALNPEITDPNKIIAGAKIKTPTSY